MMNKYEPMPSLPEGFALVYQGGHHDVYCDASKHIYTTGGWAGKWPRSFKYEGACNCAKYKA